MTRMCSQFVAIALVGCVVAATGCERSTAPVLAHGDDEDGEKSLQVTVWSSAFEIFLEHRSLVAGAPTTFVTHVTDTAALEPRKVGPVRFLFRRDSAAPLEQIVPAPSRPGIYTPEVVLPTVGEWAFELRIPTGAGESVVAMPPIVVFASKHEAAHAPSPDAPEGIAFLKEQQWKVRTKIEPVGKRKLVERLRVAGVVAARPGSRAAVAAPLAGRIVAPPGGVLPAPGDRVELGQTIALVEPPFSDFVARFLEADAAVERAKLELELADLTFARASRLADQEVTSRQEREQAEFALLAARARHKAAVALQAAYQRSGLVLRGAPAEKAPPAAALVAPIAGIVTEVAVTVGEQVPPDRALFTLLSPERVHVEARVPEASLVRLGALSGATCALPGDEGPAFPLVGDGVGRRVFTSLAVDPATRTVAVVYDVINREGKLRIGMAVRVDLETQRAEETLAVPESAIVEEEGRPVAFVQVSGETFAKRDLTLGIRDGGFVQITEGLTAGERVVTKEAYSIRLASVATALPAHGHAH